MDSEIEKFSKDFSKRELVEMIFLCMDVICEKNKLLDVKNGN